MLELDMFLGVLLLLEMIDWLVYPGIFASSSTSHHSFQTLANPSPSTWLIISHSALPTAPATWFDPPSYESTDPRVLLTLPSIPCAPGFTFVAGIKIFMFTKRRLDRRRHWGEIIRTLSISGLQIAAVGILAGCGWDDAD
ncbi:hypothetical protein BDK51DRAFT_37949, partial [Blyttiomyces helicus]